MTVTALQVTLNGKILYTIGMENWAMLGASVHGHRYTKERIVATADKLPPDFEPTDSEGLRLSGHVGVPDPNRAGSSSGQNYESHNLVVGDEVVIRVIETDRPDLPNAPKQGHDIEIRSSSDLKEQSGGDAA